MISVLHNFVLSGLHHWVANQPFSARAIEAFVIAEIGAYWGHRWMHEIPAFWRFHVIHHSSQQMDWMVNTRAHPLDIVFMRFCAIIPLYILGFAQVSSTSVESMPLLVILATAIWGYFIHSNLPWRFGIIEHIVATPAFHHWHHANDGPETLNKNYSPNLPCVDWLFGTLHLPKTSYPANYGVSEKVPSELWSQLTYPIHQNKPKE